MRASLLGLVTVLAGLTAGQVHAIPPPTVTGLAPPRHVAGEHRVAREHWRVDCRRLVATGQCESILTMQLQGGVTLDVLVDDAPPAVTIDGEAVALGEPAYGDIGERYHRVVVPGGLRTLVVARAVPLRFGRRSAFLIFPADETRHLVTHAGRVEGSYAFSVLATPIAHRLAGYTLGVEIVEDRRLEWATPARVDGVPWERTGDTRRLELAPDPAAGHGLGESGRDVSVFVTLQDPGELVHHGGPMLGLGLLSAGDGDWFLARLEYEFAIADFILPGLSLDVSGRGAVLTPRVEVSTPVIALIPSIWAGVGLPIRLETNPDVGARLMLGLQLGPVGGLVSFDLRPGDDGVESEIGALVRLSL